MTGDIAVAVIALTGVLLPVYLGTSQAVRQRRAIKELADILEALPDGLAGGTELEEQLNSSIRLYVTQHNPSEASRRRSRRTAKVFLGAALGTMAVRASPRGGLGSSTI